VHPEEGPSSAEPVFVIDTRPLIRAVAQDADAGMAPSQIARRFQTTLTEMICAICEKIRSVSGVDVVVLSGGVFMNVLLSSEATDLLTREQFRVYRHRLVPPNDGGLSLGQVAVAASQLISAT
jgi:hydrogenase maturation protein HypF